MQENALITVLLKRVWNLERIASHLIVAARESDRQWRHGTPNTLPAIEAQDANKALAEPGVPFHPQCHECKRPLMMILDGTKWETFHCRECEAWYFPNVDLPDGE